METSNHDISSNLILQAQSELRLSSEYSAHVTQLEARIERQEMQLADLGEASHQAMEALMRCRSSAEAIGQLNTKVSALREKSGLMNLMCP